MSAPAAPLSWAAAADLLRAPDASETFSPLTGLGFLAVDLSATRAADPLDALALHALATLPCVTVALRPAERASPTLRERFDLVLDSEEELAPVRSAVERAPLASTALVQLLRHGDGLDVHEALLAESLVYSTLQSGPEFAAWLASRGEPRKGAEEAGDPVLVAREGGVLTLVLNRPARRNAYSAAMRDALTEALAVAVADASVEQVVLRGAGPSFCSGGDLDEFGTLPDPATAHLVRSTRSAGRLLALCAERVHARVHGACMGAGVELPAFAARVSAARDAFFALPEIGLGLVPGAGGTASLPRRIGRQRTAWLALTGERIDAPTALAWGLVDALEET